MMCPLMTRYRKQKILDNEIIAYTTSVILDDSVYRVNTHVTNSGASENCHCIYAEEDNEEHIYEIPVPTNKDPKIRCPVSISSTVVHVINPLKLGKPLKVYFAPV